MAAHHLFGTASSGKLDTCHKHLRHTAERALLRSPYDFTIVWGWRNREQQDALVVSGASNARWPNSDHNHLEDDKPCSLALDFAPWIRGDIPWKDTHIFAAIAGVFLASASELGYRLEWGGDWDGDGSTQDQTLLDWGHVALLLDD